MAINIYNTKQQALNAEKLAELFSFATYDFGGLVSSDLPIIFTQDNSSWSWSTNKLNFIGGGVDIDILVDPSTNSYQLSNLGNNVFYALEVTVPDDNADITTNKYTTAAIKYFYCDEIIQSDTYIPVLHPIGDPSHNGYYEYTEDTPPDPVPEDYEPTYSFKPSEDTSVQDKVYYQIIENSTVTLKGVNVGEPIKKDIEYYGNTCWINDNTFIIPICGVKQYGDSPIVMLFNRDKIGYESFLSARTYYHLLQKIEDMFVFRTGGYKKGDVGSLNITDNIIKNRKDNSSTAVSIDTPQLLNVIENSNIEPQLNLLLLDNAGLVRKTQPNYTIPINHGGTSASTEDVARNNLGFYYGTSDPKITPRRYDNTIDEGAVYFKIL